MKKTSLFGLLFLLPILLIGQRYKTIELQPIAKEGWKYYYNLNKVSSPEALQIPLQALNDDEVNRYYKSYKTLRAAEGFVILIPFIYLISIPQNTYIDQTTFWLIFGGTIAAQLSLEIFAHAKLGKAVDRYNSLILQASNRSLGLQFTYKF